MKKILRVVLKSLLYLFALLGFSAFLFFSYLRYLGGWNVKTVKTDSFIFSVRASGIGKTKNIFDFLTKRKYRLLSCPKKHIEIDLDCEYDYTSFRIPATDKKFDIDVQNNKLLIIPSPDMTKDDVQALQSQISDRDDMIIKGLEDSIKNENEEQKSIKNGQTK